MLDMRTMTRILSPPACDVHNRGLAARQVPGDGRERVATVASAVKVRAVACGLLSCAACSAVLSGAWRAGTGVAALYRQQQQ